MFMQNKSVYSVVTFYSVQLHGNRTVTLCLSITDLELLNDRSTVSLEFNNNYIAVIPKIHRVITK